MRHIPQVTMALSKGNVLRIVLGKTCLSSFHFLVKYTFVCKLVKIILQQFFSVSDSDIR